MSETDPTAARLAALRATPKKPERARRFLAPGLTGLAGLVAGGYFTYLASQPETYVPKQRVTSTPDAFQISPIGPQDFTALETKNDAVDPTAEDASRLVEDLRARIKYLTEHPISVVEPDNSSSQALEALQQEMTALKSTSIERDAAYRLLEIERQTLAAQVEQLETALTQSAPIKPSNDPNADLASQRAELERQAALEQAQRRAQIDAQLQAQITSPMVALRASDGLPAAESEARQHSSGDEAFLRDGAPAMPATQPSLIANPSNTIIQGTRIEAVLENAVSSDLSGNLVAIVSYDVYSMDMRRVLIPRGSKLFGCYNADVALGQKRLLVAWDRLITTNRQSINLAAYGGDRLGQSGMAGKVNTHFSERFGSAALISVIGLTPALLASKGTTERTAQALDEVGQDFASTIGDVMVQYLLMKPTISLDQGASVTVIVNGDLELY